jgi:hypothetical protein
LEEGQPATSNGIGRKIANGNEKFERKKEKVTEGEMEPEGGG